MTRVKPKSVLLGTSAFIVVAYFLWLKQPRLPDYAGRSTSVWFEDLCSGACGGTPKASRFDSACAAFSQMESNAVPYLILQLHYDRSGIRQKLIGNLRRHTMTRWFAASFYWPEERRSYAAVALRRMGRKAESAIPALLEAWANDTPGVKANAVAALESILRSQVTDGASLAEWQKLESDLVTEAAQRYPRLAVKLGIDPKYLR